MKHGLHLLIAILIAPIYINGDTISVKVSKWEPWSTCQINTKLNLLDSSFKSSFYGFLIDIFIDAAKYSRANLSTFEFECITWEEMKAPAKFSQRNDTIFLGPYIQSNLTADLIPSSVVYSTYMALVERIHENLRSNFYYLSGFSYDLWLFLVLLQLVFAHLIWIFERCPDQKLPMSYLAGIAESLWITFSYSFFFGKRTNRSLPGRIILICIMFTSFFLGCYYIAATVSRMINNYNYFQFLELGEHDSDTQLYTIEGLKPFLLEINPSISVMELQWSPETFDMIEQKLYNDTETDSDMITLIPQPIGEYTIGDYCELKLKPYHQFEVYIGYAFHKNINPIVKNQINYGIIQIQEISRFDIFRNMRFFDRGESTCSNKIVDFKRTIGLWIVLSVGIFISILMFGARRLAERKKWIKDSRFSGKSQLKKGLKLVIFEEKKRIQRALIDYFDNILVIYESKHKDIWKKLQGIVEDTSTYPSEIDSKINELDEKFL